MNIPLQCSEAGILVDFTGVLNLKEIQIFMEVWETILAKVRHPTRHLDFPICFPLGLMSKENSK